MASSMASRGSRANAPQDHMWDIMNRASRSLNQGSLSPGQAGLSDYRYESSNSTRPIPAGRSYGTGVSFPPVLPSSSASDLRDPKRVRFIPESGANQASTPLKPTAPPSTSRSQSYPSSSAHLTQYSADDMAQSDPSQRLRVVERGMGLVLEELGRMRSSMHEMEATVAATRMTQNALMNNGAESSPARDEDTAAALNVVLRNMRDMQDRVEVLEERSRVDKEAILLLTEKLRESSTTNSTLRVAVDEMRASLPLLKHQEGDLLLLKREVDHRFMEEASRNVDNIKRIDALSREVTSLGDLLSHRTSDLSEGLGRLEATVAVVDERAQQTESIIFKAQKREATRMTDIGKEVAAVVDVIRSTREDVQRLEESLSSESTLRRQSGKQFLTLIEQLRERVGEVAEASARDLTEAVGQLNLRISRIYDDVDNLVKEERVVRESGMQQLEKDVRAQLMDLEDKLVRLHQALNDARVKMVQSDEAFLAATSRLDADLQQAAKREETARTVLTEELKRTISDRMSAALDASGRLNRGQHQTIEDIREVLRIEIESRKCEQRDIRNGIESLARDWVEEFEGFRTEFRRTSNALEVRIDASEGDVMKECYEQVASLEEALAARQNLLESVNETHLTRLKTLTRLVEDENVSMKQAIRTMETSFVEAIEGVHRGQVHIETKLEHVATRLSQEMKDDRSAVHALRRSLEATARVARQANETLSRPGVVPRFDTLRKLQEQITAVSARVEVRSVLDRITEYLVDGYQSPPRPTAAGFRSIHAHSPQRQAEIDATQARQRQQGITRPKAVRPASAAAVDATTTEAALHTPPRSGSQKDAKSSSPKNVTSSIHAGSAKSGGPPPSAGASGAGDLDNASSYGSDGDEDDAPITKKVVVKSPSSKPVGSGNAQSSGSAAKAKQAPVDAELEFPDFEADDTAPASAGPRGVVSPSPNAAQFAYYNTMLNDESAAGPAPTAPIKGPIQEAAESFPPRDSKPVVSNKAHASPSGDAKSAFSHYNTRYTEDAVQASTDQDASSSAAVTSYATTTNATRKSPPPPKVTGSIGQLYAPFNAGAMTRNSSAETTRSGDHSEAGSLSGTTPGDATLSVPKIVPTRPSGASSPMRPPTGATASANATPSGSRASSRAPSPVGSATSTSSRPLFAPMNAAPTYRRPSSSNSNTSSTAEPSGGSVIKVGGGQLVVETDGQLHANEGKVSPTVSTTRRTSRVRADGTLSPDMTSSMTFAMTRVPDM